MSDTLAPRALLAAPKPPVPPAPQLIVSVARRHGISPFRQFRQMLQLRYGQNRLDFHEYYGNQVYRPEVSADERREFVGEKGSWKLNTRLSPLALTNGLRVFVRDKVLYGATIAQLGFPTTRTQAMISRERAYGNIPVLRTAEEIETFLLEQARYPLFAKPEVGSGSVGSAMIAGIDRNARVLELLNGARVDLKSFAAEAIEDYAEGLILQDAIEQHQALSEIAGRAVGTIRVVTVMEDDSPKLLYALWKIPAPTAMSDNYWQDGSMIGEIDNASGVLRQCRRGSGPDQEVIEAHPVSGRSFREVRIPFWADTVDLACRAHHLLPAFGVFGWDIAITDDGPLIIECNANPHHMLYQLATGRGILNRDMAPVLDRVADRARAMIAERRELAKKARKAK